MGFIKEFKEFALKGNMIDLAVGVVIGAAFATITKSFVEGIFMPLVGLIFQTEGFNNLKIELGTTKDGNPNYILIGQFIGSIINFLIVAFAMFVVVKGMNRFKRKKEQAPPPPVEPTNEEKLLTEIRDLLKK